MKRTGEVCEAAEYQYGNADCKDVCVRDQALGDLMTQCADQQQSLNDKSFRVHSMSAYRDKLLHASTGRTASSSESLPGYTFRQQHLNLRPDACMISYMSCKDNQLLTNEKWYHTFLPMPW